MATTLSHYWHSARYGVSQGLPPLRVLFEAPRVRAFQRPDSHGKHSGCWDVSFRSRFVTERVPSADGLI